MRENIIILVNFTKKSILSEKNLWLYTSKHLPKNVGRPHKGQWGRLIPGLLYDTQPKKDSLNVVVKKMLI